MPVLLIVKVVVAETNGNRVAIETHDNEQDINEKKKKQRMVNC